MSDRLLKESDVLRAIDNRIKELSIDPQFVQKHGIIDVIGVKKHVLAIPSADRPQGEWVDAEIPLESGDTMPIQVCNLCKTFYPLVYTGGGHRFCPNCGARMLVKDINVPNKKGADDGRR